MSKFNYVFMTLCFCLLMAAIAFVAPSAGLDPIALGVVSMVQMLLTFGFMLFLAKSAADPSAAIGFAFIAALLYLVQGVCIFVYIIPDIVWWGTNAAAIALFSIPVSGVKGGK